MARKSRPTFKKRQKEIARQQKARDKMARKLAKKEEEPRPRPVFGEEDPDIAGIQPGPQPLPEEWDYAPNDRFRRKPEEAPQENAKEEDA